MGRCTLLLNRLAIWNSTFFLTAWPDIDPVTGLHLKGDELLIKAREAMIAAVHTFNSAGLVFRGELFIVSVANGEEMTFSTRYDTFLTKAEIESLKNEDLLLEAAKAKLEAAKAKKAKLQKQLSCINAKE